MAQRVIENTIPVLAVRDIEGSIAFYGATLGFDVEWRAAGLCSVARDGCRIMLQRQDQVVPGTVWIGLVDVAIYERLQASGARIVSPPTHQPWAYEMKIADPDGNVVWLGADPEHSA